MSLYLPHQVGRKALKFHRAISPAAEERIPNTVETMANTISATIPYTLHMARQQGRVQSGTKIYMSGTRSGICASQAGLMWDAA
ncbi:MAG: 3-oxoacyl-[acyl-carrier-protein] synthase III C-terminal domain-containing protein [Acidiferrobacterales bacterium]